MIGFKKLHPDATLPTYATAGAACFDLYAVDGGTIHPGRAITVNTGLAVRLPTNLALLIYSRSGHGFKNGIRLGNAVGVVDSDYKGELMVKLHNDSPEPYRVARGERIAQAMPVETLQYPLTWVDDVGSSERGENGFGSTGRLVKRPRLSSGGSGPCGLLLRVAAVGANRAQVQPAQDNDSPERKRCSTPSPAPTTRR